MKNIIGLKDEMVVGVECTGIWDNSFRHVLTGLPFESPRYVLYTRNSSYGTQLTTGLPKLHLGALTIIPNRIESSFWGSLSDRLDEMYRGDTVLKSLYCLYEYLLLLIPAIIFELLVNKIRNEWREHREMAKLRRRELEMEDKFAEFLEGLDKSDMVAWIESLVLPEIDFDDLIDLIKPYLCAVEREKIEDIFKHTVLDNMTRAELREFLLDWASEKVRKEMLSSYSKE